jgi:hypothetical protein
MDVAVIVMVLASNDAANITRINLSTQYHPGKNIQSSGPAP